MGDSKQTREVPAPPAEHPAVRAWRELRPGCLEPRKIEQLEKGRKTNVFRLEGLGPNGSALIAKRCRRDTSSVERTVYEEVLPHLPVPSLGYHGSVPDEEDDAYCWLFLEDAEGAGAEDYSSLVEEHRVLSATWLGALHLTAARLGVRDRLPERGPGHYLDELRTSHLTIRENLGNPVLSEDDVVSLKALLSQYDLLESRWAHVEALCGQLPQTLVHGDLAEKNLRIRRIGDGSVLLIFDWETAGWGTPAVDLSQFVLDSISPSLDTYVSAVQSQWPRVDARAIEQLANIGTIFRLIYAISWEEAGIVYERWASHGLAEKCAKWTMLELRKYHARLDDAIGAVNWERVDL